MDPLLAASALSTASLAMARERRVDEEAFYRRHGGRIVRRAVPAIPAVAVTLAVVVLTGVLGGA